MPNPAHLASWSQLEQLPYLTAVITEGLRKAMGITSHFIRVAPRQDLQYKNYVIPAGSAVSMSVIPLHNNAKVFHEPETFIFERWLGENVKSDLFVFGKRPRMCSGQK
jgi:cytochrome P450